MFALRFAALLTVVSGTSRDLLQQSGQATAEGQTDRGWGLGQSYDKIVGGQVAEVGRYPYLVNVGKGNKVFCGGTLIAPRVVLSAAHCDMPDTVWFGKHNLMDPAAEKLRVVRVVTHPDYRDRTSSSDIRLLYLERDATSTEPVKLVSKQQWEQLGKEFTSLTVMGWGATSTGSGMVYTLRDVEIDYWNPEDCKSRYPAQFDTTMMCAASPGKDSCQGDSGGPLVIKGYAYDGSQDYQVGIVSWGYGCAQTYFPGVYTDVYRFITWIEGELKALGQALVENPHEEPEHIVAGAPSTSNPSISKVLQPFIPGPVASPNMPCEQVASAYSKGAIRLQCTNYCSTVTLEEHTDGTVAAICRKAVQ